MVDRPILFSAPMVRALLAGTKTQTRRIVKPQPDVVASPLGVYTSIKPGYSQRIRCPYGIPGDVLWVRERAWFDRQEIASLGMRCFFEGGHVRSAYGSAGQGPGHPDTYTAEMFALNASLKLRPAIHMPRWASRISLRITDVRVERLQDISEADAIAEGIRQFSPEEGWDWEPNPEPAYCRLTGTTPQAGYQHLWETINGRGSWDTNPWVWAVSFEMAAPGARS